MSWLVGNILISHPKHVIKLDKTIVWGHIVISIINLYIVKI